MEQYLKVDSDVSLVRDTSSNAIISRNKSEFDKMRGDLDSLKKDMNEIKTLLKNIMDK